MKRYKLTALALLGINMGLLWGASSNPEESMTSEMKSFYEMLDSDAKKQFLELDTDHRSAAMSVVEQYCKAMDECRGIREKSVQQQYQLQMQEEK